MVSLHAHTSEPFSRLAGSPAIKSPEIDAVGPRRPRRQGRVHYRRGCGCLEEEILSPLRQHHRQRSRLGVPQAITLPTDHSPGESQRSAPSPSELAACDRSAAARFTAFTAAPPLRRASIESRKQHRHLTNGFASPAARCETPPRSPRRRSHAPCRRSDVGYLGGLMQARPFTTKRNDDHLNNSQARWHSACSRFSRPANAAAGHQRAEPSRASSSATAAGAAAARR